MMSPDSTALWLDLQEEQEDWEDEEEEDWEDDDELDEEEEDEENAERLRQVSFLDPLPYG